MELDQFTGCLLGLATGDALGAPHEGGLIERWIWRLLGRTADGRLRWTDDTQMALDLAESLLEESALRADALARRFASSYRWSRGYGQGAARLLKRIRRGEPWETAATAVYAQGSFGNGAAMWAPVLALFFAVDRGELVEAARTSAKITHAHPLGIEGAVLIALSTQLLLGGATAADVLAAVGRQCLMPEFSSRLELAARWVEQGAASAPREVAKRLGNGITAPASCPTALYVALHHLERPFDEMMRFIINCGGDVDTIGAMAGALWGAVNGAGRLPAIALEARERLVDVASRMFQHHVASRADRA